MSEIKKETLNILADAISEAGFFQSWTIRENLVQLSFSDVLLYDEERGENKPHTGGITIQFQGNPFLVFLDQKTEGWHKKWYDCLFEEAHLQSCDIYGVSFDDPDEAEKLYDAFENKAVILGVEDIFTITSSNHILEAKFFETGLIAGGEEIRIIGSRGEIAEQEIEPLSRKWWAYWEDYWRRRKTKASCKFDPVCESIIPADRKNPKGNW